MQLAAWLIVGIVGAILLLVIVVASSESGPQNARMIRRSTLPVLII